MNYMIQNFGMQFPVWLVPFLFPLMIWSIFWKGLALWHAARREQSKWFIVLLVLNTAGIVEIIYLFAVLKLTFANLFTSSHA